MVNNGFHPHVWYANSGDEFYANIVMTDVKGIRAPTKTAVGKYIDRNLFFVTDHKLKDKYVEQGWDLNSIVADPLFIDPANGNFRVQVGSPALDIGFKNFPMDQFGVKKASLKAIAKTPKIPELGAHRRRGERARIPAQREDKTDPVFWLGATVRGLAGQAFSAYGVSKDEGGVALTTVPETSAAARAGLQAGDLVQAINGHKVAGIDQFFEALIAVGPAPLKLKVVRHQQTMEIAIPRHPYIEIETASTAPGFSRLPLPASAAASVSANQRTHNDPLESLVDGRLAKGYGPVFGNAVQDGAYKLDLGEVRPVVAITSLSFRQGRRGTQKVTLYGSNSPTDPGWDLTGFTPLGTIDTTGASDAVFTAASLRAPRGESLGQFRWILWSVSPVTSVAGGENTAFQELSIE